MYAGVIDNKLAGLKNLQNAVNGGSPVEGQPQQGDSTGIMGIMGMIKNAIGPSDEELQQTALERNNRNNPNSIYSRG